MYFFKSRPQVEEIFDNFYFLGFDALNCTYVLSTFKIKIIILQALNTKSIFAHHMVNLFQKYFSPPFIILKFEKNYIQQIINSFLNGQ